MRQVTTKLFKFEELNKEAKQKAIEWFRSTRQEYFWLEENRKTIEEFEKLFPIRISTWSYGDRSEGVTWSFVGEHLDELSGIRLATYIWNNYRRDLFKGKFYHKYAYIDKNGEPLNKELYPNGWRSLQRHSKIILDNSCVLTGYYMDNYILGPIYDFLNKPEKGITFEDLMNDCFHQWIKGCNEDMEHQDSDEYISDHIIANEYEFEENGSKY